MPSFVKPPSSSAGARIHTLAPSSPFDRDRFDAGSALLSEHHELQRGASLFARAGFLAGSDEARLHDLTSALGDAEAVAIVAARGGYGATRLLPALAVHDVRRANKWLVGFSDITALHALWARAELCSIHGPMVCSLAEAAEPVRREWFRLLGGAAPSPLSGLRPVRGGHAEGRLFGGNLTVLGALTGTPYLPSLRGTILLLEDVAERPYRLDRTLTTMLQAGALAGVAGVVLGQFSDCDAGPDGVTAAAVLEERLGTLGVPIVADAPFGHVADNWPLLLGAAVELDATHGLLRYA